MKRFTSLSRLVLAGTFAALLGGTAAFADVTDYEQLRDAVKLQLTTLQVNTDGLGMLSTDQLGQLTSMLDGKEPDADKAVAAEVMIDGFLHPSMIAMDSPEGLQMISDLTTKMLSVNVPYPTQALTSTQVQSLLNVFANHKKTANQKLALEAAMAQYNRPVSIVTDQGALQMEADMSTKLVGLGITPPAAGTMTFEQLGKLESIFATSNMSDEDKKAGAMVALGMH